MMQKSLFMFGRAFALATIGASLAAATAAAQTDSTPARPQGGPTATVDSAAFERARQMVLGGNAVAGRALADSLVQAVTPGTPAFGDALYWRATIAATAADAERDYRRIIIEYALAPHAGDALLALAQLEMSRGDRMSAVAHLDRFLLEFPERSDRPRAGLWLGRLLLDQNNVPKACAALRDAEASVPSDQVELKNQIEYYMPRCPAVETASAHTSANAVSASSAQPSTAPHSAPTIDSAHATSRSAPTIDSAHTSSRSAATIDSAHAAPRSAPTIDSAHAASRSAPTADRAPGTSRAASTSDSVRAAPRTLPSADSARRAPRAAPSADAPVRAPAHAAAPPGTNPTQQIAKSAAAPSGASRPSIARSAPNREAAPASAKWTVQIAAYQTPAEAEALASKMKARDYDAYVARATRIYRVRIGHFATREQALALLTSLRQRGTSGFVTTAE